jgi:putative sigma-54 modulation protein
MEIDIQAKNVKVDELLNGFILKKVNKLGNFHSHIYDVSVYLQDQGFDSKEIQIRLNVKSQTLFCKESAHSFELALDKAVEAMKRQLKKYKQK